jgi:hypothetical protein
MVVSEKMEMKIQELHISYTGHKRNFVYKMNKYTNF